MKIKMILFAMALMISATASAQFVQSGGGNSPKSNTLSSNVTDSYSRIYASYAPITASSDGHSGDAIGGFQIGWLTGRSIAGTVPVYVEYGLNAHANFDSEDDIKTTLVSMNIPVNITYRYTIPNSNIILAPYAGLRVKGNIIAKMSYEHKSISFFDKDDVGSDNTANRVQLGYQVGVGVNFTSFYVGIGYAGDMTDFQKKTKFSGLVATVGVDF